jgi:hypothetical protein
MINNLLLIAPLLTFESEDDFYHLQILKRKKEHPELGSNSYVVKTYYVSSLEYLHRKFPEIQHLCEFHNARAYINLNVRSFERTAFHTLKKITDQIMNRDFKSARKAYESVCGEFGTGREKRWIIDIDDVSTGDEFWLEMCDFLATIEPAGSKFLGKLPTKNGYHIITTPYNMEKFKQKYPGVDVHRNNPTILFVP